MARCCKACGRVLYYMLDRRTRYCNDACRQLAYRRRLASKGGTGPKEPWIGPALPYRKSKPAKP